MKNTLLGMSMVALFALVSCDKDKPSNLYTDAEKEAQAGAVVDPATAPKLEFEHSSYDFGDIPAGSKVEHYFKFTNTGKSPLIISEGKGSCGCTVPEFPKNKPIAPGATDSIKVSFDAGTFQGKQSKTVTLTTNTAAKEEKLTITANIPTGDKPQQGQPNPLMAQ